MDAAGHLSGEKHQVAYATAKSDRTIIDIADFQLRKLFELEQPNECSWVIFVGRNSGQRLKVSIRTPSSIDTAQSLIQCESLHD